MSLSKRLMDPNGYGSPPITVCCGKVPRTEHMRFVCPGCGLTETDGGWIGVSDDPVCLVHHRVMRQTSRESNFCDHFWSCKCPSVYITYSCPVDGCEKSSRVAY